MQALRVVEGMVEMIVQRTSRTWPRYAAREVAAACDSAMSPTMAARMDVDDDARPQASELKSRCFTLTPKKRDDELSLEQGFGTGSPVTI